VASIGRSPYLREIAAGDRELRCVVYEPVLKRKSRGADPRRDADLVVDVLDMMAHSLW